MARSVEKSQNIEQSIRNRITGLKFTSHASPKSPTLLGFIRFSCDYTGFEYGSIGLHTDGREFWVHWPYTTMDFHSIIPKSDKLKEAYLNIFVATMEEDRVSQHKVSPEPIIKERVTVSRKPKGCTTCPCIASQRK